MTRPPCPRCRSAERVVAHGFRTIGGTRRRSFRCGACGPTFTPGAEPRAVDPAMRAAVRRIRQESGVSYRLLALALSRHLGVAASHTAVRNWCKDETAVTNEDGTPCEYLSLLWALRQELVDGHEGA